MNTFSNTELAPIAAAYRRMLCEDAVVRNQNGIVAYSGDGSDMYGRFGPRSDTHGTGKWFTSRPDIAASYGNVGKYVLHIDNPFVFDANGAYWNEIDFEPLDSGKTPTIKMPVHRYYWMAKAYYDSHSMRKNSLTAYETLPLEEAESRCRRIGDWKYAIYSIPYTFMGEDVYNTLSDSDKKVLDNEDTYKNRDRILSIFASVPDEMLKHGNEGNYWSFDAYYDVDYGKTTVNDLVRYVRSLGGYDGVIIKNVVDGGSDISDTFDEFGSFGDSLEKFAKQTEYIVFDDSDYEPVEESVTESTSPRTSLDGRKTFRGKFSIYFRKVEKKDISRLLDEIDGYVENRRYKRIQFEKYLSSTKGIDSPSKSMYYGLFDSEDGKCLALSYLNRVPDDFVLIAEIQSIFKGCGKILIENISSLCDNMWLAADPTAKSTLVEYYRQFGFDEKTYRETKWSEGKKETFFFKTSDDKHKKELIKHLEV